MNSKQKVSVVTGPLITNDKRKVLLFKSTKWKGWVLPGGHVEFGETLKEAVIRETKEETGLDIEPIKILNYGETINPATFYKEAHFIYFHWLAKIKSGEIKLDPEEITDHKWFSPQEALREINSEYRNTVNIFIKTKDNG